MFLVGYRPSGIYIRLVFCKNRLTTLLIGYIIEGQSRIPPPSWSGPLESIGTLLKNQNKLV